MTQQVRKSYRNHRKATWAGVLVVLIAAALALVLPALAINNTGCNPANTTTCVKPESTHQKVVPSTVNVGGSNFSCASAGATYGGPATPSGMREFRISKPTPGSYTDPATGVTFEVLPPTSGPPTSFFSFRVKDSAAAVYHVGVKGGTDVAWYDYRNNLPADPALGGTQRGVFRDDNLHSTPDSKYTPSQPSFFVASITTFCYSASLTVQPSCTSPFFANDLGGTGGTVVYSAQLTPPENGVCKQDLLLMTSFTSGTQDSSQMFAMLSPLTTGGAQNKVVEHIVWTGITKDIQNPITLLYDDIPPFDGVDHAGGTNDGFRVMRLCESDPRPNKNSFDLGGNTPAMPPADADGPHTTCMLQSTDSAGSNTSNRSYDVWLFSFIDGARGGG